MNLHAVSKSLVPFLVISASALFISGCGGGEPPPPAETPRNATGSTNLTGLWRVVHKVGPSTVRTAATFVDNGANVIINDCSLGYRPTELDRVTEDGIVKLEGYYFNLAPIVVGTNDKMTFDYSNVHRDFLKMDKDAVYDMGSFSLSSASFTTVNAASNDVCVGFTDSGTEEGLILSTRVGGKMLRISINQTNSLRTGTFAIQKFGNEPATVELEGVALETMIGTDSAEVLQGTLKITRRGTVWVEGTVTGMLDDMTTNVNISFNAEMP